MPATLGQAILAREASVRLLVVCLGNICRSPMAEGVLRARIEASPLAGKVILDSVGTGNWHAARDRDRGAPRRGHLRLARTTAFARRLHTERLAALRRPQQPERCPRPRPRAGAFTLRAAAGLGGHGGGWRRARSLYRRRCGIRGGLDDARSRRAWRRCTTWKRAVRPREHLRYRIIGLTSAGRCLHSRLRLIPPFR